MKKSIFICSFLFLCFALGSFEEVERKVREEENEKLVENYETVMNAIIKAKPAAAKGQYIRSVAISTTMGPGVYVNQR